MLRRLVSSLVVAVLVTAGLAPVAPAQPADAEQAVAADRRAIPYPMTPPADVQAAFEKGTRTPSGAPGPNYWTNTAHYDLEATLRPDSALLRGRGTIRYVNNSPDTLRRLKLHLRQNIHEEGTIRNRTAEVTGGMTLDRLRQDGSGLQRVDGDLAERAERMGGRLVDAYHVEDTRLTVYPDAPLAPGDSTTLTVAWHFRVPGADNFRMGQDGETFYLGYWYPQMAVYDDLEGWKAQPYQGDGEFYMGWADYEVDVTAPEGWLVASSGTLENPADVLPGGVRNRLERARETGDIVSVVGPDQRGAGTATAESDDGMLTWRFEAERVRDVAFGASDHWVWDATTAETGDGTAMVHSFYRPEKEPWARSAEYARFSLEHLSEMILPYPYPQMTAVEGIPVGGMEYPMITIIGGDYDARGLFGVTYHEISHMWIPMVVGTDEKTHAWMDEGLTEFNETEGADDFYEGNAWAPEEQSYYYENAGTPNDAPSMRHADRYPVEGPARVFASYTKPRVMLHALRGVLGDDTFFEAYRTFMEEWSYKHPTPYDFFNTVERVSGRELDWFWTGAFAEDWALDHAIESVDAASGETTVTVRDRGRLVMPVLLEATYADGETVSRRVGVEPWMNGRRTATVALPAGTVTRVALDPNGYLPDIDRSNNDWTRDEAGGR